MVSRDPSTLQLLEVGADIRERYKNQAQECPLPFLYTALNITNRCDLDYRESKSKRLLVELMLMQLCNIGGKITAAAPQQVAVQPAAAQPVAAQPVAAQPAAQPVTQPAAQPAASQPVAAAQPVVSQPVVNVQPAATTAPQPAANTTVKTSVSIKDYLKHKNDAAKQEEAQRAQQSAATQIQQVTECQDFTKEQLAQLWAKLAEIYKTKKPRLHAIFASSVPEIKDNYVLEMTLQNSLQNDAINEVKAGFVNYIRKELHNGKIEVVTKISETQASTMPYTDSDKYKYLSQQNENLNVLTKDLNLELG